MDFEKYNYFLTFGSIYFPFSLVFLEFKILFHSNVHDTQSRICTFHYKEESQIYIFHKQKNF